MNDFMNNDYGYADNNYIGGFYGEDRDIFGKKTISPEISFQIYLKKSFNFLDNFINEQEFNLIKLSLEKYNHKLFKNPSLILISFIVVKLSKKSDIEPQKLRFVYSNPDISSLIKENNISLYDILRYCRFIILYNVFDFI